MKTGTQFFPHVSGTSEAILHGHFSPFTKGLRIHGYSARHNPKPDGISADTFWNLVHKIEETGMKLDAAIAQMSTLAQILNKKVLEDLLHHLPQNQNELMTRAGEVLQAEISRKEGLKKK